MKGLRDNRFFVTSTEVGKIGPLKLVACILLGLPFILYAFLIRTTCKVVPVEGSKSIDLEHPKILYSWHQNTFLSFLLAVKAPACQNSLALSHDSYRNLSVTIPAGILGFRNYIFTLKNRADRVEQIARAFQHGNPLIAMADGGGPYFKVKPGQVRLAIKANAELVPVAFRMKGGLEIGKTRRDRLPLPFARIQYLVGDPIKMQPELNPEETAQTCTDRLSDLQNQIIS